MLYICLLSLLQLPVVVIQKASHHTVIQNNLLFKPGDIDCSEVEGKIPNCLDSLV